VTAPVHRDSNKFYEIYVKQMQQHTAENRKLYTLNYK